MHYPADIRQVAEYGQDSGADVKPQEIKLARQLVESLAAPFDPDKYRDEFQERLREMIEAKRQGQEVTASQAPRLAPVVDLMEALQKSLASETKKKPPARAAKAQPTAAASTGKRPSRRKPAQRIAR